jgi:hypothetical protein
MVPIEAAGDRPREDSSGEVVDDRVNARLRAIEQLDDRHVDMPGVVRSTRAQSDLRLGRIQSKPGSSPASLPDHFAPSRGVCEHLADALGVEGEARMHMWRCSVDRTMSPIASTSAWVSRCGTDRGQLAVSLHSRMRTRLSEVDPGFRTRG